mmetsp:Transcript_12345/g.27487  ORF Transcript_12345/g.27487 Transcript_12345/m.27487 type:complete len:179 (+) Transcript_12345:96-632(+)
MSRVADGSGNYASSDSSGRQTEDCCPQTYDAYAYNLRLALFGLPREPAPHLVHALFRSIGDQVQEQTIQWRKKVVFVTVLTHLTEQEAVAAINSYSNTYSAKVALPWEEMRKLPRKGGKHRGDPRNLPYRGDKQNPKNLYDYERLKKKAVGKALRLERHTQKKKSQKARKKRKAAKKI